MSKRGMNLTPSDNAIHLDLIAKSRGIVAAEEYFINLPDVAKNHLSYGALLNCYCKELMTEKAKALMEKMKELKFNVSAMSYNSLMTLYTKTHQPEKVPFLIQEMKSADIMPDCYTYNVWMRALAATGNITGVERVIEEMKRDGRVNADWTTFSNLASIYASAKLIQKAEMALKELENLNTARDLGAYQFLITLYGQTGNLIEVHRVWRSLKLAHRKMANISYLNMIQVLINLKDLPAAETSFKEWESNCSTYDIRVVNALLKGYIKEGRIEDAEALKKRAKVKGGRLNAKSWEIFMEYYLAKGEMEHALWCIDRAVKKGRSQGREWGPPAGAVNSLMIHFEEQKDVDRAEKLIGILKSLGRHKELEKELLESLIRVYAAASKGSPGMRQRLKMEGVTVSEDIEKLLHVVCPE